jgi:hypothetical protein
MSARHLRRRPASRGQAMVEYAAVSTVLILGTLVAFAGWPFTRQLFDALQQYVDLFFFALNVAVG